MISSTKWTRAAERLHFWITRPRRISACLSDFHGFCIYQEAGDKLYGISTSVTAYGNDTGRTSGLVLPVFRSSPLRYYSGPPKEDSRLRWITAVLRKGFHEPQEVY